MRHALGSWGVSRPTFRHSLGLHPLLLDPGASNVFFVPSHIFRPVVFVCVRKRDSRHLKVEGSAQILPAVSIFPAHLRKLRGGTLLPEKFDHSLVMGIVEVHMLLFPSMWVVVSIG